MSHEILKSSLLGHKGRIFDLRVHFSERNYCLSASEDGTSKIFDLSSKRCLQTLRHCKSDEVLRACFLKGKDLVATAGADSNIILWKHENGDNNESTKDNNYKLNLKSTKEFSIYSNNNNGHGNGSKVVGGDGQIYACEAIYDANDDDNVKLLTAVDNRINVYDIEHITSSTNANTNANDTSSEWSFNTLAAPSTNTDLRFGGARNPTNMAYVFDAQPCPSSDISTNQLIACVLSDASLRLVDRRVKTEVIASPIFNMTDDSNRPPVHGSSVTWHGADLLVSMSDGSIVVIDLAGGKIRAILKGHRSTCFGTKILPQGFQFDNNNNSTTSTISSSSSSDNVNDKTSNDDSNVGHVDHSEKGNDKKDEQQTSSSSSAAAGICPNPNPNPIISYGSDGQVLLWDAAVEGVHNCPVASMQLEGHSLYCAAIGTTTSHASTTSNTATSSTTTCSNMCDVDIIVGGGQQSSVQSNSGFGFFGTPVSIVSSSKFTYY